MQKYINITRKFTKRNLQDFEIKMTDCPKNNNLICACCEKEMSLARGGGGAGGGGGGNR